MCPAIIINNNQTYCHALEETMIRKIGLFMLLALLASCTTAVSGHQEDFIDYQDLLGRSVRDVESINLLNRFDCTRSGSFYLCPSAGLALWVDHDHVIREIFIYVNPAGDFSAYRGDMPLGLKFYDTMGAVEFKLRKLEEEDSTQTDWNFRYDHKGNSPDHIHYWVNYDQYDMVVIYNSPGIDEDATIYAIIMSKQKPSGVVK